MQQQSIRTCELLIPKRDEPTWACIACDQFTSQPAYWQEVAALVGDRPSAYRLILPECDLAQASERIPQIHDAMRRCLRDETLRAGVEDGFILTERDTASGKRVGLVAALDLEAYDYHAYHAGSRTPVRATEGTILSRIPPRLKVRRGAPMELSHVLMLIDDPDKTVIEPLQAARGRLQKLYDFELMLNGGHLTGYAVTDKADIQAIFDALQALSAKSDLLYAVGDGNHSLATAKAYWEELKPTLSAQEQAEHPARFAMVELENIHEDALIFEPIHRVLYGCDGAALLADFKAALASQGCTLEGGTQRVTALFGETEARLAVGGSAEPLAVGTLQAFLDEWLTRHPEAELDYVHGEDAVRELVASRNAVGFLLPALDKSELFPAVSKRGALPRKTFSMGEAREKRYYMEARRLTR